MAVKGKEMTEYRTINIVDDELIIRLSTITGTYKSVAAKYELPLAVRDDVVRYGIFSMDEPCIVLYHPKNEREYTKLCIRCSHQGKMAIVRIGLFDISKQARKAYAAQENVGGRMATGLLVGGAVGIGYAVGAGISKVARAAGRNQSKFNAEIDWLGMVDMVTNEVFEVQQ